MSALADPYKTLGVARDASPDEIRRAYHKLAKQHHPDLNPGNAKAEERFKTVAAANELLSDPEKRGKFDRGEIDSSGQGQPPRPSYRDYAETGAGRRYGRDGAASGDPESGGWSADDLGDLFGTLFKTGRRPGGDGPAHGPMRGRDEHYKLTTDFLDAVNGATRRLTLPDGRTLDVKIPPGTDDGHVLRLRGQGGEGLNGGAHGDALIEIYVTAHRYFERDGQDIRLALPIGLSEAVLGGRVEVPTPGGPVRMHVPPHSDSGTELRLRGRGVPAHGERAAGNLYATLRVVLGTPDPALEDFLRSWKPDHPANPRSAMEATP
jgi:DnaJ-class molecular chaperone